MTITSLESNQCYTVGWIAALPNERAAATKMLEVIHERPRDFTKVNNDPNAYSWGSIGKHNVVIASLPAGVYGKVSATTTASYMLASFPNIRIGLLVGIGAAVPESKDIRLGDVVVSQPDGTSGGVVQYDLGKLRPNGTFERKGSLNAPPTALLSALSLIQSNHQTRNNYIAQYVEEMLERNPYMRDPDDDEMMPYGRPDSTSDKLFEDCYNHVGPDSCCCCDTGYLKSRKPRRTTAPRIFYGVIASGDKVVKDPTARKAIIEDAGERCFCIEMEAAGLMNSFPCLVIRGICDYADTHKNDLWHNYAASTAAAYAKEFLQGIDAGDVDKTPKATDTVKG
ncbi:purine and uridine phosphorylase [Aspergillus steynii IBT 23096]|uniref:Purine and uridine phosphorylase n=1 Tax=Aspergillus steynii IBT 23096 TaxID=1392250 RepID=A0A2I2G6A1_9EURO|nr:purine and uridine phosphorylase [Aspergillus steynii IBT 23096]PLB48398.1 purine and uridine phosphorylase [Aspergillus steynii IBT 23096]